MEGCGAWSITQSDGRCGLRAISLGMPVYSLHMDTLSRSKRRNAVQMAAYISAQPMTCRPRTKKKKARVYSRRDTTAIVTTGMVGTTLQAEELFNRVEAAERRKDAVVARHINVALPRGLSGETEMEILRAFAEFLAGLLLTPVFFARHLQRDSAKADNPHGHFLFATRPWDEVLQEFARKKDRLLDSRDTGSHAIERIRRAWEEIVNARMPQNFAKIDRRSHFRRGKPRHAKRHLGRHLEEWRRRNPGKIHPSEEFNALVEKHAEICEEIAGIDFEIEQIEAHIAMRRSAETRATQRACAEMEKDAEELLTPPVRVSPDSVCRTEKQRGDTSRETQVHGGKSGPPTRGISQSSEAAPIAPISAMERPQTGEPQSSAPSLLQRVTAAASRQIAAKNLSRCRGQNMPGQ